MKKYLFLAFLLILIAGCARAPDKKNILAKINNYEITQEEFEEEFKASAYSTSDTPEARREFLDILINRKLILQQAQREGLDKNPQFLKMIERYWEQSLLKLALDKKSKDIANKVSVSDSEVEEAYQKMLKEGQTDKNYEQILGKIKFGLIKDKETREMGKWLLNLRQKANLEIHWEYLNK